MKDYIALTKPRITWLILMSTGVGYFFGAQKGCLAGTADAAAHHYRHRDSLLPEPPLSINGMSARRTAKMRRTQARPLPSGRLDARQGAGIRDRDLRRRIRGAVVRRESVGRARSGCSRCSLYLFIYTPLKQRSPHSTTIGSIPGAMPPLIGFAAASGTLTWEAWVLFAILFLWQFPHFYAIAWMYKEDYARAGIRMLPVVEPDGKSTARRILLYSIALIPISLMPKFFAMAGNVYLYGALALGLAFLYYGLRIRCGSHAAAGAACVAGIGGLFAGVVQPDVVRPSRMKLLAVLAFAAALAACSQRASCSRSIRRYSAI